MVALIKASTKRIRSMAMAYTSGLTPRATRAGGTRGSNTGSVSTISKRPVVALENRNSVSGKTARKSAGLIKMK